MKTATRRAFLRAGFGTAAAPYVFAQRRRENPIENVLLFLADDLRPMLGCYGSAEAVTPNIDALAKRGLTFLNNHCQIASDRPSRESLFTGLRPDSIGVFDEATGFRTRRPNAVTLPQYFRRNGYHTAAAGTLLQDGVSWSQGETRAVEASFARSWIESTSGDGDLFDGQTAAGAIRALETMGDRKFFLAVGFERPGLPFVAPEDYFNLHPRAYLRSLAGPRPEGAPEYAFERLDELGLYSDVSRREPVKDVQSRDLVRAYLASISYVDAQIGSVLAALDGRGLRRKTAIVLLSDSGFHLGEGGYWGKRTNFDLATRTPLIISAFGRKNVGRKSRALTELVDVYPTVCELAGLPIPSELDGSSAAPLFDGPNRLWKRAVFSQQPREIPGVGPGMGYSMRTGRYRYTEWSALDSPYKTPELYDYQGQPLETENIANEPQTQTLANGLAAMMREGWRGSLPPSDARASANS